MRKIAISADAQKVITVMVTPISNEISTWIQADTP